MCEKIGSEIDLFGFDHALYLEKISKVDSNLQHRLTILLDLLSSAGCMTY